MKRKAPARPRRPVPLSPLEAHLGYWLRLVSNQVSHSLGLQLAEQGITAAEWAVLRALYQGERMPTALAARLGLTRSAISKLAERLSAKLMVTQRPARTGDRRAQILALTQLGRATVPVLATIADENEEALFGFLDRNTRESLKLTLREIVRRHGLRAVSRH